MKKKISLAFTLLLFLFSFSDAHARKPEPFLNSALQQAYADNSYILLHFYATWCFMCKAQKPIVDKLMTSGEQFRKVITFTVPYDDAISVRKEFGMPPQSTLIVLHGAKEIARSSRLTHEDDITQFLKTNIPLD